MTIEEIMKQCRFVTANKNRYGDDRCYFEDEANKILYVFGPAKYMRSGFESTNSDVISVIDFEGGPYIGIGDEILSGKYAIALNLEHDHDVPVLAITYDVAPPKKNKPKKKSKKKTSK